MNRRSRMITHCLFHQFSRKFNILNGTRIIDIHVNIIYKQKIRKISSMNVEITNESKLKINSKLRESLKSLVMSKFVEQLFDVYIFF